MSDNVNHDQLLQLIIESLAEKKALKVVVLDISSVSTIADYMVVCTGTSSTHIKGIANGVSEKAKEQTFPIYNVDGKESGEWILLDLGNVIVNIMQENIRSYYQLEKLWNNGKVIYAVDNVFETPKAQ